MYIDFLLTIFSNCACFKNIICFLFVYFFMLKVQPSSPAHIRQSTFINSELNLSSEKNTFSIVGNFFNLSFHVTTHMAQLLIDNVSHTCEDPIFSKN